MKKVILLLLLSMSLAACSQKPITAPDVKTAEAKSEQEMKVDLTGKWLVTFDDGYATYIEITNVDKGKIVGVYESQFGDKKLTGNILKDKVNLNIHETDKTIKAFVDQQVGSEVSAEEKETIIKDLKDKFSKDVSTTLDLVVDKPTSIIGDYNGVSYTVNLENHKYKSIEFSSGKQKIKMEK